MLKLHDNFASDISFFYETFLSVCFHRKTIMMTKLLFLLMFQNMYLFFAQCRVLSAGLDSNIRDLIFNMKL